MKRRKTKDKTKERERVCIAYFDNKCFTDHSAGGRRVFDVKLEISKRKKAISNYILSPPYTHQTPREPEAHLER